MKIQKKKKFFFLGGGGGGGSGRERGVEFGRGWVRVDVNDKVKLL